MYKIIGADGREYGPVSAEQLRGWIAQRRADIRTQVHREGSADWRPLADLPEFAEALGLKALGVPPAVAVVPPATGLNPGERLAAEIIERDYHLYVGDCLARSWSLLRQRFWLVVGGSAIVFLLDVGACGIPIVGAVAGILLTFVLWGGLDLMFLKVIRGHPADVGTAFTGFSVAFVPLLLAGLVSCLLASLGFLCCILPGIYLSVCWQMFAPLLILDKGLDFWQALECSRRVVTHHWWTCFALALVSLVLLIAGVLACGIGFFVALPLATGMIVCAYEAIFGRTAPAAPDLAAPVPVPPAPPAPTPPAPSAPEPAGSSALTPADSPAASPVADNPPSTASSESAQTERNSPPHA